jgi:predicted small integral membrane protein
MTALTYVQGGYLLFLGAWLGLAAFGNIVDRGTNRALLQTMLSMKLIKEPPVMGTGIWSRAVNTAAISNSLLWVIVIVQVLIALLLSWAGFAISTQGINSITLEMAHIALGLFGGLWAVFMTGGLWFGYWMKTWHLQLAHMFLMVFTLLGFLLLNMQPRVF